MCLGLPTLHYQSPRGEKGPQLANWGREDCDGPNRKDAQGREETFGVILACKASLYCTRALSSREDGQQMKTRREPRSAH